VIDLWSQVIVEGRIETNDLKFHQNTVWMTHPKLFHGGGMVGCVTLPGNSLLWSLVLLFTSDNQVVLKEDLCLAHMESVEVCKEVVTHDDEDRDVKRIKVIETSNNRVKPEFIENIMNSVHSDVPKESRTALEQTLRRQPYDLVPKIDGYAE